MLDYQGKKFKKYIADKKLNKSGLAKKLGISRNVLYKYFSSESLQRETVINIITSLGVTEYDIWANEDGAGRTLPQKMIQYPADGYIPVYDVTFTLGFTPAFIEAKPELLGYVNFPELSGASYIVQAKGMSMSPLINDKDFVGIRPVKNINHIDYGNPYGLITEDLATFKRIRKSDEEDKIKLICDNPEYDTYEIEKNSILNLFLVTGILSVKSIAY